LNFVPVKIAKERPDDKLAYLKAKCLNYEKSLKENAAGDAVTPNKELMQEFFQHILTNLDGQASALPLSPLKYDECSSVYLPLKDSISKTFPLLDDEYLLEEQTGYAGGYVCIKQTTNFATAYFFDDSNFIPDSLDETEFTELSEAKATDRNPQEEAEALQKTVKTVVEVCKGLVKVVPAPYGTILSGVFEGFNTYLSMVSTSDKDKDTENMINRINDLVAKLTWKTAVRQIILEQSGKIDGIVLGLSSHYAKQKKDRKDFESRYELVNEYLIPYQRELDTVLSTLCKDEVDVASIPQYCLGAGAYICILQELAVLDKAHQDDPFKSQYCSEIKDVWIPMFIKYITSTYDKIVSQSRKQVEDTTEHKWDYRFGRPMLGHSKFDEIGYTYYDLDGVGRFRVLTEILGGWYYDNATLGNYPHCFQYRILAPTWAWETSGKARSIWIANKQKALLDLIEQDLGDFKKLALNEWTELKTKPLYGSDKYV